MQVIDGAIREAGTQTVTGFDQNIADSGTWNGNGVTHIYDYPSQMPAYYWQSYPVYVCTDKTAKAIAVLKALEADGITQIVSVSKFIELVEKIAALL
jgi:hypothetical protein